MIKEAIGFGNTVDEAKEDATLKLGAKSEEDVQFEIISLPKKKVLGIFGGSKAEVKAYVERADKPAKKSNKSSKKSNADVKNTKKEKVEKSAPVKKDVKTDDAKRTQAIDQSQIDSNTPTGKAISYLNAILKNFGCENVSVKAEIYDSSALIVLEGENLGVIIGHRGETLDALQHLVSLAASNSGSYFKITLNIGDYREKREQTLISLATRVAEQVKNTTRNRALEPMSAYERRIIHTAIQNIDGVCSASVGDGKNRRVVVFVEGGSPTMPRRDNSRRRDSRDRKPSNVVSSNPNREPKRDAEISLYSKISANNKE